jgi:hypothetical protein
LLRKTDSYQEAERKHSEDRRAEALKSSLKKKKSKEEIEERQDAKEDCSYCPESRLKKDSEESEEERKAYSDRNNMNSIDSIDCSLHGDLNANINGDPHTCSDPESLLNRNINTSAQDLINLSTKHKPVQKVRFIDEATGHRIAHVYYVESYKEYNAELSNDGCSCLLL